MNLGRHLLTLFAVKVCRDCITFEFTIIIHGGKWMEVRGTDSVEHAAPAGDGTPAALDITSDTES